MTPAYMILFLPLRTGGVFGFVWSSARRFGLAALAKTGLASLQSVAPCCGGKLRRRRPDPAMVFSELEEVVSANLAWMTEFASCFTYAMSDSFRARFASLIAVSHSAASERPSSPADLHVSPCCVSRS